MHVVRVNHEQDHFYSGDWKEVQQEMVDRKKIPIRLSVPVGEYCPFL